MKVFILGVAGFIGAHLVHHLLDTTDFDLYGLDIHDTSLTPYKNHPRFHFHLGDMTKQQEWVEKMIQECDVVIPLAAIANPSLYVKDPLKIFELDFEANLRIIRLCAAFKKHLIFPSTSEVYGMSPDLPFREDSSRLMVGPIYKERWIYSSCKQLLDRLIYAYGKRDNLSYIIFRPFNWIGVGLDGLGYSPVVQGRSIAQFVDNIARGLPVPLVAGGHQKRCFMGISDAVRALATMIEYLTQGRVSQQVFNIGNPHNELSLGEAVQKIFEQFKKLSPYPVPSLCIHEITSQDYFGQGYDDLQKRVPCIEKAQEFLNWTPVLSFEESISPMIMAVLPYLHPTT